MAKKLEISHASQILTNDRQILVLSYLITAVKIKSRKTEHPLIFLKTIYYRKAIYVIIQLLQLIIPMTLCRP